MFGDLKGKWQASRERGRVRREWQKRQQARYNQEVRPLLARDRRENAARRAATTTLPALGVAVRDGLVYKQSFSVAMGHDDEAPLGKLAGAHAEVVGGQAGHRRDGNARVADTALAVSVAGPLGLLAGVSRKGFQGTAFVVLADSTMHEVPVTSREEFVRVQADAVRFNALAQAATPTPG